MGKIKKVGKHFLGYKTGRYWDYKLGQVLGITNRGKRDSNQSRYYKSVQNKFHVKVKILADFEICISVLLNAFHKSSLGSENADRKGKCSC